MQCGVLKAQGHAPDRGWAAATPPPGWEHAHDVSLCSWTLGEVAPARPKARWMWVVVSHPSVWARDGRGRGGRREGRRGTVGEGGRGPCVAIGGPLKGDGPAATGGGAGRRAIRALTLAGRASRRPRDNSQTPRRKTRRLGKSPGRSTADSRRRMAGWRREAMDVAELRALGTNLAALGPLGPSAPSAAPTSAGAAR